MIARIIKLLVILAITLFYPRIEASEDHQFLHNVYDLAILKMDKIDNSKVSDKFIQTANEVDYWNNNRQANWYISELFEVKNNTFYILLRDLYFIRYYYLCKQSKDCRYPIIVCLCNGSMGGETIDYFEIDWDKDILFVEKRIRYNPVPLYEKEKIGIHKTTYNLADDFKIISRDRCHGYFDNNVIVNLFIPE